MAERFSGGDRGILENRPEISFVEPKVITVAPTPIPELPKLIDHRQEVDKIKALAQAVDVLATAIQAKVDLKAKDLVIDLDPDIDAAVVDAMGRMYPDADSNQITYQQYRECKEHLRQRGIELAEQALQNVNGTAITEARKAPNPYEDYDGAQQQSGWGSAKAKRGGLRPELDPGNQIIKPLNIGKFQDFLVRMLVNFMWKTFIRPSFAPIRIPKLGSFDKLLPKRIAKMPKGVKVKDLQSKGVPLLGEKKKKPQKAPKFDAKKVLKGKK